jgi:predicted nucleic acid-binding protein
MRYVVDASVALKWLIDEADHDRARRLLVSVDELHAPDLVHIEVANAAWRRAMRRDIDRRQAEVIVASIMEAPVMIHRASEFTERALDIALELSHPIYDCVYLACAEATAGVVVTADDRLVRAVRRTEFAPLVQHLADFPGGAA